MTKPRVYKMSEVDSISRRLRQHPPYIWVLTEQGPAKILDPVGNWFGPVLFGINGKMEVEPRYCGTISNY